MPTTGVPWTAWRLPYTPATCAHCGAFYVARHPCQRYCGPTCKNRACGARFRARHRERVRAQERARYWAGERERRLERMRARRRAA